MTKTGPVAPSRSACAPADAGCAARPKWLLIAGLASCLLLLVAFQWHEIYSTDLGWQLRAGEWIVQHGRVPREDQLAFTTRPPYTAEVRPWVEARWLFCVLQYWLWQAGGPAANTLFATAIVGGMFALIAWRARSVIATPAGLLLLAAGIWCGSARYLTRPEIVSYFFIVLYLLLLDPAPRRDARGGGWRGVWSLPLLQILWTNMHGLFIFGPGLVWLFAISAMLQRGRGGGGAELRRPLAGGLGLAALTTLACFVNPYGWEGVKFPFLLYTEIQGGHVFSEVIGEFVSPLRRSFWQWSPDLKLAPLLGLAALLICGLARSWRVAPRAVFMLATAALAAMAVRNVTLFVIAACWTALTSLADWRSMRAGPVAAPAAGAGARIASWLHGAAALVIVAAAWYVASGRFAFEQGVNARFGFGLSPWMHGQNAVRFLLAAGPRGNVFHHMLEGGWLAWAAKGEYPVFIDGRLEVYGTGGVMADYLATGEATFPRVFEKYGINTAIVDFDRMPWLVNGLRDGRNWTLVHIDPRKAVFVRNIPEHADLIAKYGIDPQAPYVAREPEPSDEPSLWGRLLGERVAPRYSLGMAAVFLQLGGVANAQTYLQRAVEQRPDWEEARLLLGYLRRFQGRTAEAEQLMAGLRPMPFMEAQATGLLAGLHLQQNRPAEALPLWQRALELDPDNLHLRTMLGDTQYLLRDLAGAEDSYRRVLSRRPQNARLWRNVGVLCELQSKLAGATEAYQKVLELQPGDPVVYNQLGVVAIKGNDPARARAFFEQALKLRPDYESARENLKRLNALPPAGGG